MRGRRHGNEVATGIDAARETQGQNPRKAAREGRRELARVEVDALSGALLAHDRARDHVAGRQLRHAVQLLHEALAVVVHERRALAAHRLRDQRERIFRRVERRGMELHELHVGERHARAMRDGVAVSGRDDGIRGVAIHLPASAGREHGDVRNDLRCRASHAGSHADARVAVHDQIQETRFLEDAHAFAATHTVHECARDFGARLIAVRVHDALARVRGFASETQASGSRLEIELCPRGLELAYARRPLFHEHLHRGGVA